MHGLSIYRWAAACAFLLGSCGADVAARMTYSGEGVAKALNGHLQFYTLNGIGGLIMLAIPYLALASTGRRLAKRMGHRIALWFFGIWAVVFVLLDGWAFAGSAQAMSQHKWTAASLALGLTIMFAMVLTALMAAMEWSMARLRKS